MANLYGTDPVDVLGEAVGKRRWAILLVSVGGAIGEVGEIVGDNMGDFVMKSLGMQSATAK